MDYYGFLEGREIIFNWENFLGLNCEIMLESQLCSLTFSRQMLYENRQRIFCLIQIMAKQLSWRSSLVVQWLRLCTLNAGGLGSRSQLEMQLRVRMPQRKIPHSATEDPTLCN